MQTDLPAAQPWCGRDPLIAAITAFLARDHAPALGEIAGSEALFPMDEGSLNPVPIEVRIGAPIDADGLRARSGGNRQIMMDTIGLAIAALLPPKYRGAYASASREG